MNWLLLMICVTGIMEMCDSLAFKYEYLGSFSTHGKEL